MSLPVFMAKLRQISAKDHKLFLIGSLALSQVLNVTDTLCSCLLQACKLVQVIGHLSGKFKTWTG